MSPVTDVTLAGTLADLADRGFTAASPWPGTGCARREPSGPSRAEDLTIREFHRFEGISDPDDMSIVYAIESRDGTRGTLVDAFGVYSNPAVTRVLERVPIRLAR